MPCGGWRMRGEFIELLAAGVRVEGIYDDPCHLEGDAQARPGSWGHMLGYVQQGLAVVARREG